MAELQLKVTLPNIDKVRKQLSGMEGKAEVAMSRAINRTVNFMASYIPKNVIEKRYIVKKGVAKKSIKLQKSNKHKLSGKVELSSKLRVSLSGFGISPRLKDETTEPFSAKVLKANTAKLLTGDNKHSIAFAATMRNKHTGLFQRKLGVPMRVGFKREQIVEMKGPSIPSMARSDISVKTVRDEGQVFLKQRLDHEIQNILRGH